ncbi:MAG: hypothetical protein DMG05_20460 [Acidobacteria bacterium]|nr:MAG: hypothetical protein DMG05_20460 [Acidobacteriota bacterium]
MLTLFLVLRFKNHAFRCVSGGFRRFVSFSVAPCFSAGFEEVPFSPLSSQRRWVQRRWLESGRENRALKESPR